MVIYKYGGNNFPNLFVPSFMFLRFFIALNDCQKSYLAKAVTSLPSASVKKAYFGPGLHMVKNGKFQNPTTKTSLKGKFHAKHFLIKDSNIKINR